MSDLDPSSLVGMVDPNKVCWDTVSINLMNKDGAKVGLIQQELLEFDPSSLRRTVNVYLFPYLLFDHGC